MLTADPRVVPDARVIPQLNVREAAELAYYGAKVLHPRALIPIARRGIPVFVRPFAQPQETGTEISGRRTLAALPGQGAVGDLGPGAPDRHGQRDAWSSGNRGPHLRRAPSRRHLGLAHLAGFLGALDLPLGSRGAGADARGRASSKPSPRRSRGARSTAWTSPQAFRRSRSSASEWRERRASPRGSSRRSRAEASTSSPSRRAPRS